MRGDNHDSGLLERCDGCDAPFAPEELTYCPECCYDLCEDCLESGESLDGRHTPECREPHGEDGDEEFLEPALDKESNTQ